MRVAKITGGVDWNYMKNYLVSNRAASFFAIILSVFFVVATVQAATTISTNISTGGTLTVTGESYLTGNVGIGTTSPANSLHVVGYVRADRDANQYQFYDAAGTALASFEANVSGTTGGALRFKPKNTSGSFSTRMMINHAGNVGIGSTDPDSLLTIPASSATAATSSDQIRLRSARAAIVSGNLIGGIDFMSNDTNLTAPGQVSAGIQALAEATHTASVLDTGLAFFTLSGDGDVPANLAEQLRISAAGNVGIGTTTPATRLHVSNGASATTTVSIGELGLDTSKACVNMNQADGSPGSFYLAGGAVVVSTSYCQ